MKTKMKLNLLIIFLFIFSAFNTIFGQNNLAASKIPAHLKENADAVVRFDNTILTVESDSKFTIEKNWAVTIFNEKGEENFAVFQAYYDKYSKVKKIEGTIYDAFGESLKKLKHSEISDYATYTYALEVDDSRVKVAAFDKKKYSYPYTIEFSYELENTNTFLYPNWTPIKYDLTGIESSSLIIKSTENGFYRKKENLISSNVQKDEKYRVEIWNLKNFPPQKSEEFVFRENNPYVILSPSKFKMAEYRGIFNTWNDVGNFYLKLNQGRDFLPQETITKLKEYIGNEKDTHKKVSKIYEFMQSHTRYFAINLDIGGWQSMKAEDVAKKGYGDCKALSNYTIALLKSQNIKAYPTLIHAGDITPYFFEDFPEDTFNHVFVCVPMAKDTIWLECTSQNTPAGYLGDHTGNRKGLLIKENTSEIVNTIHYKPEENLQSRKAEINMDENGNIYAKYQAEYSGIQQESRFNLLLNSTPSEQKEWVIKKINLANSVISDPRFESVKATIPLIKEKFDVNITKYGSLSGPRLFLKPNIFSKFISNIPEKADRKHELYLDPNVFTFNDSDEMTFTIPANFKVESMPKEAKLTQSFGTYIISFLMNENKLTMKRELIMKGGIYPKEEYTQLLSFIRQVNKFDQSKVVFVKN